MLNDTLTAAQAIQNEIKTAEAAIDDALASLGRLTSRLVHTWREFEVDPTLGTKAFDRLGEATSLMCQTRTKVLGVHSVLSDVREVAPGFRELGFGALQRSSARLDEAAPTLRAIA